MGYLTRSKGPADMFDLEAIDPLFKHGTAAKKKSITAKKKKTSSKVQKEPILTKTLRNIKDGKDHQVIEADGRDHYHIRYNDDEQPITSNKRSKNGSKSVHKDPNEHEFTFHDHGVLPNDSSTPAIESNRQHALADPTRRELRSSISGSRTGYSDIKSKDHHIRFDIPDSNSRPSNSDDDIGIDHDLEMPSITTSFGNNTGDNSSMSIGARAERAKAYFSSFFQSSDGDDSDILFKDGVEVLGDEWVESTRNQDFTSPSQKKPSDLIGPYTLAEKSEGDLHNARDAIISLEQDVALLQRQLNAKEETLKSAQAKSLELQQLTAYNEELKNEIYELESTILTFQSELSSNLEEQQQNEKNLEKHGQEISRLTAILKSKENIQQEAESVKGQLHHANSQCASLTVQIHELKTSLSEREKELLDAQVVIKNLEKHNEEISQDSQKAFIELGLLKVSIAEREEELESCLKKIEELEGAENRVRTLEQQLENMREQLSTAEIHLGEVELANKSMIDDTARCEQLTEEVRVLKAHIKDSEWRLNDSMSSLKELSASQDRAVNLEKELKDMNKLAKIQEKHLQYLENALKAHEHCANDKMRVSILEKEMEELRDQTDIKEKHLAYLETALMDHERCAETVQKNSELENELEFLRSQIRIQEKHLAYLEDELVAHEGYDAKIQQANEELSEMKSQSTIQERHLDYLENALHAHEKCESNIEDLRNNITALTAQLSEKEAELHSAAKILSDTEAEVEAVSVEMQSVISGIQEKDNAFMQIKENAENEIAKISSTANILRTEVESLHEQVRQKSIAIEEAQKDTVALLEERSKNSQLGTEIKRLETVLADKEQSSSYQSMILENMRERVLFIDELGQRIEVLQKEKGDAEAAAAKSTIDFIDASNTASQLVVQVEYLREQLTQKEADLANASELAIQLEEKSNHIKNLLKKISVLEEANENIETFKAEVAATEAQLRCTINDKQEKMNVLNKNLDSWEQHEVGWINRTRELSNELIQRTKDRQTKDKAIKDMKYMADQRNFEINRLNNAINFVSSTLQVSRKNHAEELHKLSMIWETHDNQWIEKASDLTSEILHKLDVIREKERTARDLKQKAKDQDFEIARLNEALDAARTELRENRKRKASEIEDQTNIRTQNLKGIISDLEDQVSHLEKKIRLDEEHMTDEIELGEQIRELLLWKQNSIEQTREWETTVTNLMSEKMELLTQHELQLNRLMAAIKEGDSSRLRAEQKVEKLSRNIRALEGDLKILKGEKQKNIELEDQILLMSEEIGSYKAQHDELHLEILELKGQAAEFEERKREDISTYKIRLGDACDELENRDKKIDGLNSKILGQDRYREALEMGIEADEKTIILLEHMVSKLRNTLVAQVEKYEALERKHIDMVKVNEVYSANVSDPELEHGSLNSGSCLEENYKKSLLRINELELEAHKANIKYHTTLSELKNIQSKLKN